jgi:hypothetical protein
MQKTLGVAFKDMGRPRVHHNLLLIICTNVSWTNSRTFLNILSLGTNTIVQEYTGNTCWYLSYHVELELRANTVLHVIICSSSLDELGVKFM